MLKYELLSKKIEQDIDSKVFQPGVAVPSIRKFVAMHNVSRSTVEKSLDILTKRGKLRHLPGLGYFVQERPAAAIGHIAFVTHLLANDTSLYVKGLMEGLDPEKYTLSTFSAHADLKKYQQSIEQLAQLQPTGIIIHTLPHELCKVDLSPLINSGIPIVAMDIHMPELTCDRVFRSRQNTADIIARFINESGLRDPTYISSNIIPAAKILFNELKKDLSVYNIDFPENRCFFFDSPHGYSDNPDPYIDAEEQMTAILKKGFSGKTIVCGHDFMAVGVLRAILKAGLKVPEDIAIISAKSCVIDGVSPMKLTTVDATFEQQGRIAAKLLTRRIEGLEGASETHYLSGNLIVGETT